jgi:hypothetical protein
MKCGATTSNSHDMLSNPLLALLCFVFRLSRLSRPGTIVLVAVGERRFGQPP